MVHRTGQELEFDRGSVDRLVDRLAQMYILSVSQLTGWLTEPQQRVGVVNRLPYLPSCVN